MTRRGSYGLVLTGLTVPDEGLCTLPDDSPELQVRVVRDFSDVSPADRVEVIDLLDDGRLALNADASLATYVVGEPPSAHEILHPWLAQAAINRSLALDRLVLHGGLLSTANGAVAVLGDREAGKSTLMAHAAMAGVEVLSDDVVVVDGPHVLTGPRCIDLREPAAARLLTDLRVVRDGSRWRMALPPAPWRSVLSGVVVLRWGDRLEVTRLPPRARLAELAPHLACAPTPRARARLLPAAEIPVTVIARPRDFGLLDAVLKHVLGV